MFVCGSCHLEMKRTELGVTIIEMFSRPPKPYKLWKADVLTCPLCEHEMIQSASKPYAEHFQPDFNRLLHAVYEGKLYRSFERVTDAMEYQCSAEYELQRAEEAT